MYKEVIFRGIKNLRPVIIYYDGIAPILEVINLRNEKKVSYLRINDIDSFLLQITECYYYNEKYIKFIDNKYQYIYN